MTTNKQEMNIEWGCRWREKHELSALVGEVLVSATGLDVGHDRDEDEVVFITSTGMALKLYHEQDCCENVRIVDVELDCEDFSGATVLSAEVVQGDSEVVEHGDSQTYTFYKIETTKGGIWIRWLGESNGFYSESVDILTGKVISNKGSALAAHRKRGGV